MQKLKSIEKTFVILLIISAVIITLSLIFRNTFSILWLKSIFFVLIAVNLFVPSMFFFPKETKKVILSFFVSFLIYLPFFFYFRQIRNLFPKPAIVGADWVGFANYFKYPLAFDTFFFLFLILVPVIVYLLVKKYVK